MEQLIIRFKLSKTINSYKYIKQTTKNPNKTFFITFPLGKQIIRKFCPPGQDIKISELGFER